MYSINVVIVNQFSVIQGLNEKKYKYTNNSHDWFNEIHGSPFKGDILLIPAGDLCGCYFITVISLWFVICSVLESRCPAEFSF